MLRCCFGLSLLLAVCSLNANAIRAPSPVGTQGKRSPFGLSMEHLLNEKRSPYGLNLDSMLEDKRSPASFDFPMESKRSPYGMNLDSLMKEKRSPFGMNMGELLDEAKRSPFGMNMGELLDEAKRSPFGMNMGELLDEAKRSPFGLEIGSLLGDKRNWEDSEGGEVSLEYEKRSPFRLSRIGALQPREDKRSPFRLSRIGAIVPASDKRSSLPNNKDLALHKVILNPTAFGMQPAMLVNALSELIEMMKAQRAIRSLAREIQRELDQYWQESE